LGSSCTKLTLGDADLLKPEDKVEQAVYKGAAAGLYPVTIMDPYGHATNSRGVEYRAIYIQPDEDQTTFGDSGSGLYLNGTVYGVNNSGEGIYGAITSISHIRNLASRMTQELRTTF